jgi:hypothetical protein
VDTVDAAAFAHNACSEIIDLIEIITEEDKDYGKLIADDNTSALLHIQLLQMCFSMQEAGRSFYSVLLLLKRLITSYPILLLSPHPPIVPVAIIALLPTSNRAEQLLILEFLSRSLESILTLQLSSLSSSSSTVLHKYSFLAHTLTFPLLQLFSSADPALQESVSQILHKAELVVLKISPYIKQGGEGDINNNTNTAFSDLKIFGEFLVVCKAWFLSCCIWSSEYTVSLAWLGSLTQRFARYTPFYEKKQTSASTPPAIHSPLWQNTMLLVAPFLAHSSPHVRACAARVFPVLASVKGAHYLTLSALPLLSYRMTKEEDSQVIK